MQHGGGGGGRPALTRSQLKTVALRHITLGSSNAMHSQAMMMMNASQDIALPDLFFRLVWNDVELYKSEVATKTLNPVWAPVELSDDSSAITKFLNDDSSGFDVVVYRLCNASSAFLPMVEHTVVEEIDEEDDEDDDDERDDRSEGSRANASDTMYYRVPVVHGHHMERPRTDDVDGDFFEDEIFRFNVQLDELEPLNCDFRELYYLPLNTLVLGFSSNQYYVRRDVMSMLVQNGMIMSRRARDTPTRQQRSPFDLATAATMLNTNIELQRQINQTHARLAKKRQEENALLQLQERVLALRNQAIQKQQAIDQVKSVLKVEKHMLSTDQKLARTLTQLSHLDAKETEMKSGILYRRMDILRVAHSIRALQATLVSQLYDIYPIAYLGAGEYSIGGIKFTNADIANGKDEELLSTALGYIAHFVFLLAKYLNVNLRYAIVHLSSRSYMRDDVNDPHGEYPLYRRGVDKERFEKAFLFLKKDVEQLLSARGLDPGQQGQLLMRLTSLVESEMEWLKNNS
ncbi:Aste57867_9033 [Aphanomyces stellatus]|uniref:Aste57867_9033 protein n=1 Tax=Aphanomyces stellatus TaxID=120398 RepID=A0A485KM71_9STRA|nr:hypothetical protein As57867_008997 [Aphanomyces stellatus]VFT85917.1 Aste57867_9033 [Aphanomyces stellatus]